MTNIINNTQDISNYMSANTGITGGNLQNSLAKSKQAVTDNFESNSAIKTVSGNASDPAVLQKTLLLLPPLVVLNNFIDKKIGGAEEKSILTKIASVGDKLSKTLHLDNLFSDETGKKVSSFFKNNKFFKYFSNDYKAIPKSSMAKSQTLTEKYVSNAVSALQRIKDVPENVKYFDKASGFFKPETLNFLGFADDAASAAKTVLSKDIIDDLTSGIDKILKDGGADVVKNGSILPSPIRLSEINNKLKASTSKIGKTGIGKAFAKGTLKAKDLFTYGGGLMGLAFTANSIIQAVKATKEAPKGEKKSTFMHVLSEQYIGMLLFQPSINLLYKAGGNKYRGMTIEGRNALKELVQNTNANKALTKEGYQVAKLQSKLLLKGVSKDKVAELAGKGIKEAKTAAKTLSKEGAKLKFWEKPLKAIGKLLDTGLDSIKSPTKAGKIGGKIRGFAGGLGRFLLILMVIQPLIQKPVTKLCHKIFGEPKEYLKKQQAANNAENNSNIASKTGQAPQNNNPGETNLIKKWTQPAKQEETIQPQTMPAASSGIAPESHVNIQNNISTNNSQPLEPKKQNEIPAFNILGKDKETSERYIPSIEPAVVDDNEAQLEAQVNEILKNTDKIMASIKKSL